MNTLHFSTSYVDSRQSFTGQKINESVSAFFSFSSDIHCCKLPFLVGSDVCKRPVRDNQRACIFDKTIQQFASFSAHKACVMQNNQFVRCCGLTRHEKVFKVYVQCNKWSEIHGSATETYLFFTYLHFLYYTSQRLLFEFPDMPYTALVAGIQFDGTATFK